MIGQERRTVDIPEAAQLLGISRNSAYESVRRGELPAIRFGRRLVVPRSVIERILAVEGTSLALEGE